MDTEISGLRSRGLAPADPVSGWQPCPGGHDIVFERQDASSNKQYTFFASYSRLDSGPQ
jgi:hypothetical protein